MNTLTKMVLISETEYNKKCQQTESSDIQPILNTNLTDDLKIRLINQIVYKSTEAREKNRISDDFKDQINDFIQIQNNQNKFQNGSSKRPVVYSEENQEPTNIPATTISSPNKIFRPIATSTPSIRANENDISDDKYESISPTTSYDSTDKTLLDKSTINIVNIEEAIRKIPGLIDGDNILKLDGTPMHNSKLSKVLPFLFMFKKSDLTRIPTPRGVLRVLDALQSYPELMKKIDNNSFLTKKNLQSNIQQTWKGLSKISTSQ